MQLTESEKLEVLQSAHKMGLLSEFETKFYISMEFAKKKNLALSPKQESFLDEISERKLFEIELRGSH